MLEAFLEGLTAFSRPDVMALFLGAILVALILGIIPGIGAVMVIILLLPFMFGMEPLLILPVICALFSTGVTAGSITAIMVGIPGDGPNIATILDGFPMTRRGEGARAIGAALFSSVAGGVVAVAFAFGTIAVIMPVVLKFRSAEMLLLIVLGLLFLSVLSRGSVIKGIISAGLGLLIASIGYQAVTGSPRFNFGSLYLYDGLSFIVVMMGIFAMPVLVELAAVGKPISSVNLAWGETYIGIFKGIRDVFRHWWLFIRCTVIGYIIGVIPGLGSAIAIWITYGHAKQSSKYPDKFGTGVVEGVIAPESSNNATSGGSLLTTLAFGIPGSSAMVLVLAGLLILGITPGPRMLAENLPLAFTMLQSIAFGNIIVFLICFATVPILLKVTRISPMYLFAIFIPIMFTSVYIFEYTFLDMAVAVLIGIFAILLIKTGFPMAPLLLGFILGELFEYYLWHALPIQGNLFFISSPITIVLTFLIVFISTQRFWNKPVRKLINIFKG